MTTRTTGDVENSNERADMPQQFEYRPATVNGVQTPAQHITYLEGELYASSLAYNQSRLQLCDSEAAQHAEAQRRVDYQRRLYLEQNRNFEYRQQHGVQYATLYNQYYLLQQDHIQAQEIITTHKEQIQDLEAVVSLHELERYVVENRSAVSWSTTAPDTKVDTLPSPAPHDSMIADDFGLLVDPAAFQSSISDDMASTEAFSPAPYDPEGPGSSEFVDSSPGHSHDRKDVNPQLLQLDLIDSQGNERTLDQRRSEQWLSRVTESPTDFIFKSTDAIRRPDDVSSAQGFQHVTNRTETRDTGSQDGGVKLTSSSKLSQKRAADTENEARQGNKKRRTRC